MAQMVEIKGLEIFQRFVQKSSQAASSGKVIYIVDLLLMAQKSG